MARAKGSPERELRELAELIRRRDAKLRAHPAMVRRIPDDLALPGQPMLSLRPDERTAFERVKAVLDADPRYECLDRQLDEQVWRFVCEEFVAPEVDHVAAFIQRHAREPTERLCYMPVEWLRVDQRLEAWGAVLLPLTDPDVPKPPGEWPPHVSAIVAVTVSGTHPARMASRARKHARYVLRALRIGLHHQWNWANQRQYRFRLSQYYAFQAGGYGWDVLPDDPWQLRVTAEGLQHALNQPLARVPLYPSNDLERQASTALDWLEEAALARTPVSSLLYLFFALEALLGDKSEGLKGHGLAFRRALLSVATQGTFANPSRTFLLYKDVRSAAVHGEPPPAVDWNVAHEFAWDVEAALNEYVDFARTRGLEKRKRVLHALRTHERRQELADWLLANDASTWRKYLTNPSILRARVRRIVNRLRRLRPGNIP